jgi:hypothetical protein
MRREMVLNDLCVARQAANLHEARERMALFVLTLVNATHAGAERSLRCLHPIDATEIAPGYPVARWRNDSQVEKEQRTYLSSLLSKSPLLTGADEAGILERGNRSEFLFDGRVALGLGAAILLDALAVSFASEGCWDCDRLLVACMFLDDQEELEEESIEVFHASRPEHTETHQDWLSGRSMPVRDGWDLWLRREQLFPSLCFCEAVAAQLAPLSGGDPLVRQIWKRLGELDRYFSEWDGTRFAPEAIPMKITPESASTLERYKEERSILCPDGARRTFSWHGRLTPGVWRLYFEPDPPSRKAFIGYIGRKPPGTLYST